MFVLIHATDFDGLEVDWKLYETYEEAYKAMHDAWTLLITLMGFREDRLHGEDGEPYCLMWHAAYNQYDEHDCCTGCTEWHIVNATKEA